MNLYLGRIWNCQIAKPDGKMWLLDPAPKGMHSPDALLIPLPRTDAPETVQIGDSLDVFVYLDTNDKPIATTAKPKVMPGEVAFLKVVDSTPFGYFMDWGLPRDLFVPFRETLGPMEIGEMHAISPYIDDTERLAGTCRLSQVLEAEEYSAGDRVEGVIWRHEPGIGTFVILERHSLALIPATEVCRLEPGTETIFRVSRILEDEKVEVSLREPAHQALDGDAQKLMEYLARPGVPKLSDDVSPALVTARLSLSKKAMKRAAGHLLKQGIIALDDKGYYQIVPEGQRTARRPRPRPTGAPAPAQGPSRAPAEAESHPRAQRGGYRGVDEAEQRTRPVMKEAPRQHERPRDEKGRAEPAFRPSERRPERPSERNTERFSERNSDRSSERSSERFSGRRPERPSERSSERPSERSPDRRTEKQAERPVEKRDFTPSSRERQEREEQPRAHSPRGSGGGRDAGGARESSNARPAAPSMNRYEAQKEEPRSRRREFTPETPRFKKKEEGR